MLIPSIESNGLYSMSSLSRRVNANSQPDLASPLESIKLIKKGEC